MKSKTRIVAVLVIVTLLLSSIFVAIPFSAAQVDTADEGADYNLASNVQDGTILHAFCCSFNNIKNRLSEIAQAGFTTIQTSPVQQPKDYGNWNDFRGQWWKLYQPLSYSVATGNSWVGTKSELTNLCNEAHKYGIKIICDIVANHSSNDGSNGGVDWNLSRYESQLYNNKDRYFHTYVDYNDSSIRNVVWGNIGLPDLNTSDSYVQSRIASLLKECVDCGVDGFRFDAAKHIETPDDGEYASDFWPNVLGEATSYASSTKGKELYYYGEILNTVGNGRSYKSYSKYMSVTDNITSDLTTASIKDNRASAVAKSTYNSGLAGNKIVLWAESHDTYSGDSGSAGYKNTSDFSQTLIDKSYAFSASRKGASSLYLVRPNDGMCAFNSNTFKSSAVTAANKFHNLFIGAEEKLYSSDSLAICERYSSNGAGMVIVNCGGDSTNVNNVKTSYMPNGSYKDAVSGNTFTVSNGTVSGSIGSAGVAIIYNASQIVVPTTQPTTSYVPPTQAPTTQQSQPTVAPTTTTSGDNSGLDFSNPLTVYLYNTANWRRPCIYMWSDNGNPTGWPGYRMEKYSTIDGIDVYSYTLPSSEYQNIIFSDNGTPQTRDLTVHTGKVFWDNQKDNWDDATRFEVKPTQPTQAPTTQAPTQAQTTQASTTSKPISDRNEYTYGDVDFDKAVTIVDASSIQKHLASLIRLSNASFAAADVDGNRTVDIIDATLIQKRLANLISSFPAGEKFYY